MEDLRSFFIPRTSDSLSLHSLTVLRNRRMKTLQPHTSEKEDLKYFLNWLHSKQKYRKHLIALKRESFQFKKVANEDISDPGSKEKREISHADNIKYRTMLVKWTRRFNIKRNVENLLLNTGNQDVILHEKCDKQQLKDIDINFLTAPTSYAGTIRVKCLHNEMIVSPESQQPQENQNAFQIKVIYSYLNNMMYYFFLQVAD